FHTVQDPTDSSTWNSVGLHACNGTACSDLTAAIQVTAPSAPQISTLGCPGSVQVTYGFTCNPTIQGAVTTYAWTTYGPETPQQTGTSSTFSANFHTVQAAADSSTWNSVGLRSGERRVGKERRS